jgi:uroporphyrin-III C-methyltransferase
MHPFEKQKKGKVYLVGAGPGDPELLTVKALRTLALADVVLYDALVSRDVLALVSPAARLVDVGKRCGEKHITQDEINELLVRFALLGEVVVRLKSGDPLIFGRAGEELEALRRAGIEVEIVPGVTAALAAAATAQVALTDRRTADHLLIVSAHREQGKSEPDWHRHVTSRTTVVIYMPGEYTRIGECLERAGLQGDTACMIISKASTPEEQLHRTTLDELACAPLFPGPSILIVGETVAASSVADLQGFLTSSVPLQADFLQATPTIEP